MLKTIIIDDEEDIVNLLKVLIEENCRDVDIAGTANSVDEAVSVIQKHDPDLIFLDIEMPHGSGFDLLEKFPERTFDVIFVTAYNSYGIRAIRASAADYIVKPVNIKELYLAVEKVKKSREQKNTANELDTLLKNLRSPAPTRLAVHTNEGIEYIEVEEIIRLQAERSYCQVFLKNKRKIIISKSLLEIEQLLDENRFFRTHKSHLVNLECVRKFNTKEGGRAVMTDGSEVPVAAARKNEFAEAMKKNL